MSEHQTTNSSIDRLGRRAVRIFNKSRAGAAQSIHEAAARHGDSIKAFVNNGEDYVSSSWNTKFSRAEAWAGIISILVFACMWYGIGVLATRGHQLLAMAPDSYVEAGGSFLLAATLLAAAILWYMHGMASLVRLSAIYLIRGSIPFSDRTFVATSEATWALGQKNLYLFQCQIHGFDPTFVRVVPYEKVDAITHPSQGDLRLALRHDAEEHPNNVTKLMHPMTSDSRGGKWVAEEIARRATEAGRQIDVRPPSTPANPLDSLYPPLPSYRDRLRNRPALC